MTPTTDQFTRCNKDGTPKRCKFCHEPVWFCNNDSRWYDPGGHQYHIESCKLRQDYFRGRALDTAQTRRMMMVEE